MQEVLQALKDVWATMDSLGWKPAPIAIAIVTMLAARSYFEPDVLQVNTPEAVSRMGKIKLRIFLAVTFVGGLMQIGFARPANSFDWCLSIGFSIGDTMVAYVVSSSAVVRNFLKNSLFKGGVAAGVLLLALSLSACSFIKHASVSPPVQRVDAGGGVTLELEPKKTFDRDELPAGVKPEEIASVITLFPMEESNGVVFDQVKNSKPAGRRVFVKKDGTVIAGAEAAQQIASTEKIEPSYTWLWWLIATVLGVGVLGYGIKQLAPVFKPFAKIVSFIEGIGK